MSEQWTVRIAAIVLLIVGFSIRYVVARRKFNRRAMTGAESFRSFERALSITFVERVARWLGTLLIIIGTIVLLSTITNFRSIYELSK